MLAPAKMPVTAGKKMANTEKNDSPSRNSGTKFSVIISPAIRYKILKINKVSALCNYAQPWSVDKVHQGPALQKLKSYLYHQYQCAWPRVSDLMHDQIFTVLCNQFVLQFCQFPLIAESFTYYGWYVFMSIYTFIPHVAMGLFIRGGWDERSYRKVTNCNEENDQKE